MLGYSADIATQASRPRREIRTESELEAMVLQRLRQHPEARAVWKVRLGPDGAGSWTWKYAGTDEASRAYLPLLDAIIRELRNRYDCRPDILPTAGRHAGVPSDAVLATAAER